MKGLPKNTLSADYNASQNIAIKDIDKIIKKTLKNENGEIYKSQKWNIHNF